MCFIARRKRLRKCRADASNLKGGRRSCAECEVRVAVEELKSYGEVDR